MRIGAGIALFTLGAIFTFAISWRPSGLNIPAVGVIFMLVGIVWAVAAVLLYRNQRRSSVVTERRQIPDPVTGEPELIEEKFIDGEPERRLGVTGSGPEVTPYAGAAPETTPYAEPTYVETGYSGQAVPQTPAEPEPAPYEADRTERPFWRRR